MPDANGLPTAAEIAKMVTALEQHDQTNDVRHATGSKKGDLTQAYIAREIADHVDGNTGRFPVAFVNTVVKALDAACPDDLAERVTTIANLFLAGKKPDEIASATNLPLTTVKAEINRLDAARRISYEANPEKAVEVVEKHFDVIGCSEQLIADALGVFALLQEEINLDHKAKLDLLKASAETYDPEKADKLKEAARKAGIKPKQLEGFTQIMEGIGKHQDRIAEMLGLMRGKGNNEFNAIVNNFTFQNDQLNAMADQFMHSIGAIPITAVAVEE